jgi:intein/homing endonuclease
MPKCCIAFGRCSYLYFYLLIAIISNTIRRLITGSKTIVLNNYYLIQSIYKYFGEMILGALFYFILNRFLKEEKNTTTTISRQNTKTSLIYNNRMVDISKIDIFTIIIACSF